MKKLLTLITLTLIYEHSYAQTVNNNFEIIKNEISEIDGLERNSTLSQCLVSTSGNEVLIDLKVVMISKNIDRNWAMEYFSTQRWSIRCDSKEQKQISSSAYSVTTSNGKVTKTQQPNYTDIEYKPILRFGTGDTQYANLFQSACNKYLKPSTPYFFK